MSPQMQDFEEHIGAALREEAEEAARLVADSQGDEPEEGMIHGGAFVESVRESWLGKARSGGRSVGQSAWLQSSEAAGSRPPVRRVPGVWWASAAAAAAVLAAAIGWDQSADIGSGFRLDPEEGPRAQSAAYLHAERTGPSIGTGKVPNRGPSTVPGILPETVDFSEGIPMDGMFRIEIHDVARGARIDDVPRATFTETIYEPRWTCSETDRAELPDVFWLEVYRGVDPPGSRELYKKLFARQ